MFDPKQGIIIPEWPAPKNIRALVTTRTSFQSISSNAPDSWSGYDHFNLALHVNDDINGVLKKRELLARHLDIPPDNITWLEQIHSTEFVNADTLSQQNQNKVIRADASFSQTQNKACTIMTADCLPVFFCNIPNNNEPQQVAAAHAGWRGLAGGILKRTLAAYPKPENVIAWLGPAISQSHFKVGQEVYTTFISKDSDNKRAFMTSLNSTATQPKFLANLNELARIELHKAGISAVYGGDWCTYAHPELFYSYRRDGEQSGRMASVIMLTQ